MRAEARYRRLRAKWVQVTRQAQRSRRVALRLRAIVDAAMHTMQRQLLGMLAIGLQDVMKAVSSVGRVSSTGTGVPSDSLWHSIRSSEVAKHLALCHLRVRLLTLRAERRARINALLRSPTPCRNWSYGDWSSVSDLQATGVKTTIVRNLLDVYTRPGSPPSHSPLSPSRHASPTLPLSEHMLHHRPITTPPAEHVLHHRPSTTPCAPSRVPVSPPLELWHPAAAAASLPVLQLPQLQPRPQLQVPQRLLRPCALPVAARLPPPSSATRVPLDSPFVRDRNVKPRARARGACPGASHSSSSNCTAGEPHGNGQAPTRIRRHASLEDDGSVHAKLAQCAGSVKLVDRRTPERPPPRFTRRQQHGLLRDQNGAEEVKSRPRGLQGGGARSDGGASAVRAPSAAPSAAPKVPHLDIAVAGASAPIKSCPPSARGSARLSGRRSADQQQHSARAQISDRQMLRSTVSTSGPQLMSDSRQLSDCSPSRAEAAASFRNAILLRRAGQEQGRVPSTAREHGFPRESPRRLASARMPRHQTPANGSHGPADDHTDTAWEVLASKPRLAEREKKPTLGVRV